MTYNRSQGRSTEELMEISVKCLAREQEITEEEARAMIERVRAEISQHPRHRSRKPIVLPEQRTIHLDDVLIQGRVE